MHCKFWSFAYFLLFSACEFWFIERIGTLGEQNPGFIVYYYYL